MTLTEAPRRLRMRSLLSGALAEAVLEDQRKEMVLLSWLLRHGREYAGGADPKIGLCPPGSCFASCQAMALSSRGRFRYAEGFGIGAVGLTPHAWIVDKEGRAIDLTWPAPSPYFGIEFPTGILVAICHERGGYSPLLTPLGHWPPAFLDPRFAGRLSARGRPVGAPTG